MKTAANVSPVTPEMKATSGAKFVVKKKPGKTCTPPSVKSAPAKTPELRESAEMKIQDPEKKEGIDVAKAGVSTKEEGTELAKIIKNVEDSSSSDPLGVSTQSRGGTLAHEEIVASNIAKSPDNEEISIAKEASDVNVESREEVKHVEEKEAKNSEMEAETNELMNYGEEEGLQEPQEDLAASDAADSVEEKEVLEEEHRELTAIANERKISKEHEIFVGGLDKDTVEDDVKRVFESIGEVVEVRLHKNSSNKNKCYAFVKFANKEHASQALAEMKNPVVRVFLSLPFSFVCVC